MTRNELNELMMWVFVVKDPERYQLAKIDQICSSEVDVRCPKTEAKGGARSVELGIDCNLIIKWISIMKTILS